MAPVYTITRTHIELKFSGYYKYIDYNSKINREHRNEKTKPQWNVTEHNHFKPTFEIYDYFIVKIHLKQKLNFHSHITECSTQKLQYI